MRGRFRLWHQEPKGLQRTQSGSGATSVRPGLFHSFRHSFIDALRVANVGDEIKHALLGWSGGGIPAKYGAKDKVGRFRHRLAEAVANVVYTGLDLSHITKRHGVETEIDPND